MTNKEIKNILKCYCCKEVKRLNYNFKNEKELNQVLLLLLTNDFKFDYKQNYKSNVISIIVDEEDTYHWLIKNIEKKLKQYTYKISISLKN